MKNVIPNTTELMLAVAVNEMTDDGDNSKCTDVIFVPIVGWTLETIHDDSPVRVIPVAVGSDNDDSLKVAYETTTEKWYVCNGEQQGSEKKDLIKLFNINKEISIQI